MSFTIVRQDITRMQVDAIVNAANSDLQMGGGVCGAIFRAAGAKDLQTACDRLSPVRTGGAVVTPAFALPCRYVIHAVGPVYRRDKAELCEEQLRSAYTEALYRAAEQGCVSVAFPLISSGIYGYPKAEALRVASHAIHEFLLTNDMEVFLVVFHKEAFSASTALLGKVEAYIDENYVEARRERRSRLSDQALRSLPEDYSPNTSVSPRVDAPFIAPKKTKSLRDQLHELDAPFGVVLLRLIDEKGMTDSEVYKRANLDRKLFNKIKNISGYMPGKRTVIALAIGLRLTLPETEALLKCAGYALSHSQKFDVIVEYFIVNGEYDYLTINEVLFQYDQALLGSA